MIHSKVPNVLGYIIKLKETADISGMNSTLQNITTKVNTILRRRKPATVNVIPTISNIFTNTVKGFATGILTDAYISSLETDVDVELVEPDIEMEAYPQTIPWGVSRIGATAITSTASINGTGSNHPVNIFILDTGVKANHPDLNCVSTRTFVPGETADDLNGHGTAVAGVAAARDNTEGIVGIAPGAPIHSYKCLNKNGSGQLSWIISAVDAVSAWKTANPSALLVVNMSLGGYTGSFTYTSLDIAIVKLIQQNIPVVVAAGNSGDLAGLYTPAHTTEAITVGAYDVNNQIAGFSNYGSNVDILAPGVNILTTGVNTKTKKPTYVTYSGTSFSSPYVAGSVALYIQQNIANNPTPAMISTAIKQLGINANNAGTNTLINTQFFPDTTRVSVYVSNT